MKDWQPPKLKTVKYPLLSTYKKRMQECWQGKFFGIMMPTYFIVMALSIIFLIDNIAFWFLTIPASALYFVSFILLMNYDMKADEQAIKRKAWGSKEEYERGTGESF